MLRPRALFECLGCVFLAAVASATIIDRVAIVVDNQIVKNSDIDRNIRVTNFLDGAPVSFTEAARKEAAGHLIDQLLIRREISLGGYGSASMEEADRQLQQLVNQKYRSQPALEGALKRYGLDELQLRQQFQWQLTVLNFIDLRFKPAAFVTDDQIQTYYNQHAAALKAQFPGKDIEYLRPEIEKILRGEQVNQLFFAWLDQQRKDSKIKYLEESLR